MRSGAALAHCALGMAEVFNQEVRGMIHLRESCIGIQYCVSD